MKDENEDENEDEDEDEDDKKVEIIAKTIRIANSSYVLNLTILSQKKTPRFF